MSIFGNIGIDEFLKDYWQKKPLLVRNAFPDFQPPIEPDDMAGLATMEEVESRIIIENTNDKNWQLKHGPFNDETFETLPNENWTLLVQGLDQWVPEAADLLEHFNFIPKWRLDDVMVSFAPKGGGVGPHYDLYDTFLIQGIGQRKWQVGPKYDNNASILANMPVKILSHMQVDEEWILNPGDMLYLPPAYGHNGVAQNDCTTFSVGFRAPSEADILQGFSEHLASQLSSEQRYSDPDLKSAQQHPALIEENAIERLMQIIEQKCSQKDQLKSWLAQSVTESKYEDLHEPLEEPLAWDDVSALFQQDGLIIKNETSCWAYFYENESLVLYINGQQRTFQSSSQNFKLAALLADKRQVKTKALTDYIQHSECQQLMLDLINGNYLYFENE